MITNDERKRNEIKIPETLKDMYKQNYGIHNENIDLNEELRLAMSEIEIKDAKDCVKNSIKGKFKILKRNAIRSYNFRNDKYLSNDFKKVFGLNRPKDIQKFEYNHRMARGRCSICSKMAEYETKPKKYDTVLFCKECGYKYLKSYEHKNQYDAIMIYRLKK